MFDNFAQVIIIVCGMGAAYLFSCKHLKVMRWGFVVMLVAEPLWFYTTYVHQQWGLFALTFFYTFSAGRGVYNHFYSQEACQ